MKKNILIATISLISTFCFGQETMVFNYKNYPIGKISFANLKKKEVSDIKILGDKVSYVQNSKRDTTALSDINYLRLPEKTQAGGGALIGGLVGASVVLREVLIVESNPNLYYFKPNAKVTYALIILGSTGVGALIGSALPKWKIYYLGNQKLSSLEIKPSVIMTNNSVVFGLKVQL